MGITCAPGGGHEITRLERDVDKIYNDEGHARVRVEQAGGIEVVPGIVAEDPDIARPHFEKLGWVDEKAYSPELGRTNPKITLDDGTVLWGYQCWWSYVTE